MRVFVGFGGNVGSVEENLRHALESVDSLSGTTVRRISSLYRTAPVGVTDQPEFVNGAVEVETALVPEAFLRALLDIEGSLGRVRERKWGPRTVDLDVLLWGQEVLATPALEVPHPRLHERAFVLVPLAEIASDVRHPVLGATMAELLTRLGPVPDVQTLGRPGWLDSLEKKSP